MKVDSRDWRSHLEQMHTYRDGIEQALESTKSQLDKLHTDVSRTLEKISSREKYLNSQLEAPLADLRQLQDNLAATKEQYRQVNQKQVLYKLFVKIRFKSTFYYITSYFRCIFIRSLKQSLVVILGKWRCN